MRLRSRPTDRLMRMMALLFENLDDVKRQMLTPTSRTMKDEIEEAFDSACLPVSIDNIQVWSAQVSAESNRQSGSLYTSVSDNPIDPREKTSLGPVLLDSVGFSDSLPTVKLAAVERLVDMEDE